MMRRLIGGSLMFIAGAVVGVALLPLTAQERPADVTIVQQQPEPSNAAVAAAEADHGEISWGQASFTCVYTAELNYHVKDGWLVVSGQHCNDDGEVERYSARWLKIDE